MSKDFYFSLVCSGDQCVTDLRNGTGVDALNVLLSSFEDIVLSTDVPVHAALVGLLTLAERLSKASED